jgi:hypothetical protein
MQSNGLIIGGSYDDFTVTNRAKEAFWALSVCVVT